MSSFARFTTTISLIVTVAIVTIGSGMAGAPAPIRSAASMMVANG